ncbi:MAG TPA: hypothetical protein H9683_00750 [Firmicutes bacterium]|nr:hypothetical protein [Bacillota bacterium]
MKDFAGYTGGGVPDDLLKEAQAAAAQFDGKNESELIRSIYARAAEGKRAGTLTNEQIDAFCAQFAPMLDAGKRKKLMKLAAELKKM